MLSIIKEMIAQRGFDLYLPGEKTEQKDVLIAKKDEGLLYVKIYEGKLELNVTRKFISDTFLFSDDDTITLRQPKEDDRVVVQVVVICKSFQNSHLKDCQNTSRRIQLIRSDFFNVNITQLAPRHEKVDKEIMRSWTTITPSSLPTLLVSDPNCTFYNFRVGDLVRITRAGGEIGYRMVRAK